MKTKWLILSLICLGVTYFISCSQPGPTIDEPTIDPADVIASGTCGDSLTWTLAKDGLLLISGKGNMMSIYDEMSVDTCYPWYNYKDNITRIFIGNGVTSIEDGAFESCKNLTSITFSNSVVSIEAYAFAECTSLVSINFSNSIVSIGAWAFSGCTSLVSLAIPASVKIIDYGAFDRCSTSLTSIIVSPENTKYDSRNNCNAIIEKSTNTLILGCQNTVIPERIYIIGAFAFSGCSNLTSITIPDEVTGIETQAFEGCSGLSSVTIPRSVTSIYYRAFFGCSGLTTIFIPNSVTTLQQESFSGCSGVESIVIEQGHPWADTSGDWNAIVSPLWKELMVGCKNTVIPDYVELIIGRAFYNCTGLTSITLPASLKDIWGEAFYGCTGLTSITCYAIMPPKSADDFYNVNRNIPLLVPAESVEAYRAHEIWGQFDVQAIE